MDNLLSEDYYKDLVTDANASSDAVNDNTVKDPSRSYEEQALIQEGIDRESHRVIFTMLDNGCPPEKISFLCGYSREYVEKMIRLWDSDLTKVSPLERKTLDFIEEEMRNGEYITADQIMLQLKQN